MTMLPASLVSARWLAEHLAAPGLVVLDASYHLPVAARDAAAEFAAGCVLNLWLGLGVWDYTDMPFNLMGQICLPFSAAWIVVSAAAILLDDWLRWQLYGEDKPHYRWI